MASIKFLKRANFPYLTVVYFDNKLYISEEVVKFLKESKDIKKKLFEVIKLTIR
ncbi:hypothetical protein CDUR_08700 [Corynebacterium durum]|nr:hypothetical protein [Corynebacterium durum]WJY85468.1 hypothetical protein CDUR_08700 [Corynebacterium durum]